MADKQKAKIQVQDDHKDAKVNAALKTRVPNMPPKPLSKSVMKLIEYELAGHVQCCSWHLLFNKPFLCVDAAIITDMFILQ